MDVISDAAFELPALSVKKQLDNQSIARYSRQLILPEIGVKGQLALANSSVLIVGAGGLGCPVLTYLAAGGVGRLGVVDYDEVELSNLHRQTLHTEQRVGAAKSASAAAAGQMLNSSVDFIPYHLALNSQNAMQIIKQYDVIVDATDNVATRYLLNDACVLASKPLVSGSALRFEGQLTVYNYEGGPCYRCLYPKPPPPETVTNCSDGGVMGAVPGVIGNLQALEVIKILTKVGNVMSQKLLLFDGLDGSFRTIKLRQKQKACSVCGEMPSITQLIDYEQFCGSSATDKASHLALLDEADRISVREYNSILQKSEKHILVDVRPPVELEICKLANSINIPFDTISKMSSLTILKNEILSHESGSTKPVYVICKQGNDSQKAVKILKEELKDSVIVKDIRGGLQAWSKQIDPSFPRY